MAQFSIGRFCPWRFVPCRGSRLRARVVEREGRSSERPRPYHAISSRRFRHLARIIAVAKSISRDRNCERDRDRAGHGATRIGRQSVRSSLPDSFPTMIRAAASDCRKPGDLRHRGRRLHRGQDPQHQVLQLHMQGKRKKFGRKAYLEAAPGPAGFQRSSGRIRSVGPRARTPR